jgi:hypothetical protein
VAFPYFAIVLMSEPSLHILQFKSMTEHWVMWVQF